MFGEIKRKLTKKSIIVCFMLAILISVYLGQCITITFELGEINTDIGEMQLYYQNNNNSVLSEKYSCVSNIENNEISFKISKQLIIGNQIRLDPNNVSQFEIEGIRVNWNILEILNLEQTEIYNRILNVCNINEDDKLLKVNGEDSNIVIELPLINKLRVCLVIWGIEVIIITFLLFFLYSKIQWIYKKDKVKCIKWTQYFVAVFMMLCICWYGIQAIKTVYALDEQSYYVNEGDMNYQSSNNEIIRTEFTAIANNISVLEIDIKNMSGKWGDISYQIVDKNGQNVKKIQETSVEKFLSNDSEHLNLDVTDVRFEQGEKYVLITQFTNNFGNLLFNMSKGELVLCQSYQFEHQILYISIILLCCFSGMIFIFILMRFGLKRKVYIIFSLIIGILAIFIVPPASRDDEYRHFVRAYSLAKGELNIPESDVEGDEIGNFAFEEKGKGYFVEVPKEIGDIRLLDYSFNYNDKSYYAEINQNLCIDRLIVLLKDDPNMEPVTVSVVATAQRGLLYYWPQVIAIWIGMILGCRPILLFYFARLGQLVVCVLFGGISLKLAEKYKDFIWLLSFVPNIILLKISCNSDGLLIAEIILYLSLLFYLVEKSIEIFTRRGILILGVLFILGLSITIMKPPYIILCMVAFIMLDKKNLNKIFEMDVKKLRRLFAIFGVMLLLVMSFMIYSKEVLLLLVYKFVPKEHILYLLSNPKKIIVLFCNKFIQQIGELYLSLNGAFFIPYALIMIVSLYFIRKYYCVWKKSIFVFAFALILFGMILVGYTLTPPDTGIIWGITYRYMLPSLPLLGVALPNGTEETENVVRKIYPIFIVGTISISNVMWIAEMWTM